MRLKVGLQIGAILVVVPLLHGCNPGPCDGVRCSGHGRCEVYEGQGVCDCYEGYEGVDCGLCSAGFVEAGEECLMLPPEQGFENTTRWRKNNGASVDIFDDGFIEPGIAQFSPVALCNGGHVSQSFEMPLIDLTGPLMMKTVSRSHHSLHCIEMLGCIVPWNLWLAVNGRPVSISDNQKIDWMTRNVCLGERAFGSETTIVIQPELLPEYICEFPEDIATIEVDHVSISSVTEDVCPLPGQVLNGDFERGGTGWEIWKGLEETDISINESAGINGSCGARFTKANSCDRGKMEGLLSVPLGSTLPDAAIEIEHVGSEGASLSITFADMPFGELVGTRDNQTWRMCLPAFSEGMVQKIAFELNGNWQNCEAIPEIEHRIDNLRIVTDPACESSGGVIDGGFELASAPHILSGWRLQGDTNTVDPASVANIVTDPNGAHSGNNYVHLEVSEVCQAAYALTTYVAAHDMVSEGAAVSFWYRTSAVANAQLLFGAGYDEIYLEESTLWKNGRLCLTHADTYGIHHLKARIDGGRGDCQARFPAEHLWIDDVEIVSDQGCQLTP